MSKGKKRRQKGEYTRPRHEPAQKASVLPPAKAERVGQALGAYMLMASLCWLWEVEDVDDVPILHAATKWFGDLSWPQTEQEFWTGPPLLEREPRRSLEGERGPREAAE